MKDQLRAAYEDDMAARFDAADQATHGYMVSAAGEARGLRGSDLYWPWQGRAHERWASSELRAAWDHGTPRPVSYTQWRAVNAPPSELERRRMTKPKPKPPESELLDYRGASELLGLPVTTLREYRSRGDLPEPDGKYGHSPVWKRSTLTRWDAARKARNANSRHEPIDWSAVGF